TQFPCPARSVSYEVPEARTRPGSGAAAGSACPFHHLVNSSRATGTPVYFCGGTFQILIVLSELPEASSFPSGLNARDRTASSCPVSVATSLPVATVQSLIVPSTHPVTSVFPSGLKTMQDTLLTGHLSATSCLPVATVHS